MTHGVEEIWSSTVEGKKCVSKMEQQKKGKTTTRNDNKVTGSRRIFSPAFKLQVLDSYRKDSDCQGNQRATARKYGIHRRQIQKWLQMETNLRLTVESTNNTTALNLTRQPDANTEKRSSTGCILHTECCSSSAFIPVKKENTDTDEYVNVDEITDTEDDENDETTSISSSSDKALDFTCATLSKRRFYTNDFKLHVLDAFNNDATCKGNQRATARKFGIHRRQVQKWLNQIDIIKSEHNNNNNNHNNYCLDLSQRKRKLDDLEFIGDSKKQCIKEDTSKVYQDYIIPPHLYPNYITPSFSNTDYNNSYPYYPCCYQTAYAAYSVEFKYESYVDTPVQYGFGEYVPSKWINESPVYIQTPYFR